MWIYSRYIKKNGVRIYPRNGKVFRFWVDESKEEKSPKSNLEQCAENTMSDKK